MKIYGYCRCSTEDQDLSIQRAALKQAGCDVIREEKKSGGPVFSTGGEWRAEQLTRVEARERVLVISKDGQTTATGDWATFDLMANTVLMGDHVVVSHGKDVAGGPRLKIDLTTGMYRFVEIESTPVSPQPPAPQIRPQ